MISSLNQEILKLQWEKVQQQMCRQILDTET